MPDMSQPQGEPAEGTLERSIWRGQKLIDLGADDGEEAETQLSDVLADLMHWASNNHVEFDDAVASAEQARQAELEDWDVVQVRIVNTYADGDESEYEVWVPAPDGVSDLEDWWQDVVFEHTGDGHAIDNPGLGSLYEATIIRADDESLVGQTNEWSD